MGFIRMFFSSPLGALINIVIVACGVFVFLKLMKLGEDLVEQKRRYDDRFKVQINMSEGMFNENLDLENVTNSTISNRSINDWKEEFDRLCTRYNTLTELIPVFPLAGIFGTVTGLIGQAGLISRGVAGADSMLDNLGVAMTSTWVALVVTMLLKIYVAASTSKKLYLCDVDYESYVRLKEDSYKTGRIKEKKKEGNL